MGTIASIGVKPIGWREWLKSTIAALQTVLPKRPGVEMSVQKTVALGQKANATLLVVHGEKLLLGVTANSVSVLRHWKDEAE
jgi:flagellar biogenesis protein FliO